MKNVVAAFDTASEAKFFKETNEIGKGEVGIGLAGEDAVESFAWVRHTQGTRVKWDSGFRLYGRITRKPHFHSSSAPRLRRFSTKRGWARLMISALRTTDFPGIDAATIVNATAARIT